MFDWVRSKLLGRDLKVNSGGDMLTGDGLSDRQVSRIMDAVRVSYKEMEKYRNSARKMKEAYVGHLYSDNAAKKPVIYNKMHQLVTIYLRLLASSAPQVTIETPYKEHRLFAATFEHVVNRHIRDTRIEDVLSRCVLDGLFGAGIAKTAIAAGDEEFEIEGEIYDPGKVFTSHISVNDFVIDLQAKQPERIEFIGDRFLMPRKVVKDLYKGRNENLTADRQQSEFRPEPDLIDINQPEKRLYDMVWVWELFLPKENAVVLVPDGCNHPIGIYEYHGPEGGPYDILGFQQVPDEVMPSAFAASLLELHDWINDLARKQRRQTERQKQVLIVEKGKAVDGARVIGNANDGDIIAVPQGTLERTMQFTSGGADPSNFQSLIDARQQFNLMGGNLDAIAGLQPQSDTATQDRLMATAANALLDAMRQQVISFTKRVIEKQAWYIWTDPLREEPVVLQVPGTGYEVKTVYSPDVREGDFLQYNFKIEPYSMMDETPSMKVEKLMAFMSNFVFPSAEMAMQSGLAPNIQEIARMLCKWLNLPMDQVYLAMDPAMQESLQEQGAVRNPLRQSHTVNERVSRSATTPRGNEVNLMQSLAGARPQNVEAASMPQSLGA